jgi:uncharacterized membrane protein
MSYSFATESDRLEAFSDGVIAVIITIMVLDLKPPHGTDVAALSSVLPTFAVYLMSFVFVGIYWNNHHHMLRATKGIDGHSMWANLHLLFWLSPSPFMTAWLGEHPTDAVPTARYGIGLLFDATAYTLLQTALVAVNGRDTAFAQAVKVDLKGNVTTVLYVCAIGLAFVSTIVSDIIFVVVATMWIVPDRRFEPVISLPKRDAILVLINWV